MRKLIDTIRDTKNKVMAKAMTAVNTARENVAEKIEDTRFISRTPRLFPPPWLKWLSGWY